tara:strand:+ start:371 stop:613 length:243 start_codon:yes stop_codon:yes gene_type:complete
MDDLALIVKLQKRVKSTLQSLSLSITSGGVDKIESYKYIVGQIAAYEAILQEISNLLDNKEQYESKIGHNVIDINQNPQR